jgi:hypothetical protein
MGGSGSYGWGREQGKGLDPSLLAESLEHTNKQEEAVELAQLFADTVAEMNQFDAETVNGHKHDVLNILKDAFNGAYDLDTGGSRIRRTYIDGLSDIDLLLDLGPYSASTLPDKGNSIAVLKAMKAQLQSRLPDTKVESGRMAVTIRFADGHELQVLPAFRYHSGYRIPDPDPKGSGWVVTRPRIFANLLKQRNAEVGGRLLRTIKLGKLICSNLGVDIKSYHLENIALRAFERYTGPKTDVDMLRHLFNQAKTLATRPMPDITGQQARVDSYITTSSDRDFLARHLAAVEYEITQAGSQSDKWQALLAN